MIPWWQQWPDRLRVEIEALTAISATPEILSQNEQSGQLSVKLTLDIEGERFSLRAEFPALYPFTRPLVYADPGSFKWHQNPYGNNLCLLGRTAENWLPTQTLAQHITEQMPKLIASARSEDPEKTAGLEEMQAEPFTAFLSYLPNSSILSLFDVSQIDEHEGFVRISYAPYDGTVFRGAVVGHGHGKDGRTLTIAERVTKPLDFANHVDARCFKLDSKPQTSKALDFLEQIASSYPRAKNRHWTITHSGAFELLAAIVPEETAWRQFGWSLIFILLRRYKAHKGKEVVTAEFVRSFRADAASLMARIPELQGLQNKRILLVGAGSIGAPCALEFARNGVGVLVVVDGDVVEPGNSVRWPLGFEYSGLSKANAIQKYIAANYPYTQVVPVVIEIGSEAHTIPADNYMFNGIDLIFDATAERGISYVLSERARQLRIPYVCIESTQENWGGSVISMHPDRTAGCWWCLSKHLQEGTLPLPAAGPNNTVQVAGCSSPTFTGSSVDSSEISLMGMRLAVSFLSPAYPKYSWDYAAVSLRNENGEALPPRWQVADITRHPDCPNHQ